MTKITTTGSKVFAQLEPYLNMTAFMSDSLSRFVRHCPLAFESEMNAYFAHFEQFKNSSIGEISESFMFGILAQSITMRQIQIRIQFYEEVGDTASIYKELVGFLRILILFDNIYVDA